MNTFFSDKIILWRKMAKIWLKVKENGTKKIKLAKMVAKEKNPSVNPVLLGSCLLFRTCFTILRTYFKWGHVQINTYGPFKKNESFFFQTDLHQN